MQEQEPAIAPLPPTGQYLCDHRLDEHGACEYLLVLANGEQQWVPESVIEQHLRQFNEMHWLGNMQLVDDWVRTNRRGSFLGYAYERGHSRHPDHGHFVFVFLDQVNQEFYEDPRVDEVHDEEDARVDEEYD